MDEDYFETFTPEQVAMHVELSSRVDTEHKVVVRIASTRDGDFEIIIVGYDYPSGFSILCGLLSAFGLDIRAGEIHSFSKEAGRGTAGRIVDVLRVAPKAGEVFKNPDLAKTYRTIATQGRDAFYKGELAQAMVAFSEKHGGLFTLLVIAFAMAYQLVPLPGRLTWLGIGAAIIPFGPFWLEPKLKALGQANQSG